MRYRVWFGERQDLETVWLPSPISPTAIDQRIGRLRGWALLRGVTVAGSAFLSPASDGSARIYLPLGGRCVPDPETGIAAEQLPGGPIAVVSDVPFAAIADHVRQFASLLAPDGYRGAPEYQGGFHGVGLLTLPLATLPADPPGELLLQAQAPAPAASSIAVSVYAR